MPLSLAKAKSLCNASELSLITASTPKEVNKLSPARLRQKVTRARTLRDKWRDQAERQRRAKQQKQAARQTAAAKRSAEKAQLFAEALARFEKQLARTPSDDATVGPRKTKPKTARARQHRATRAAVRDELEQTRQSLTKAGKTARRKKAAPKKASSAGRSAARATTTSTSDDGPPRTSTASKPHRAPKKKKKQAAGPARSLVPTSLTQLAEKQGLRTNQRSQSRARTAAKTARLKTASKTRIQKHLSARTKRNQARRDAR